jgi:acyl carrier protein
MANMDILQRVIDLISTMADTEEEITEESELINDLGISSMDILFMISSLEEEFKIKVSERVVRRMYTIADVAQIVAELVAE